MRPIALTPAEIAALREIAEKATPGPWRQHLVDDTTVIDEAGNTVAQTFPDGGLDDDVDFATDTEQREHDAAFIATARTALPAALDEIERLRADNERLRACRDELREVTLAMNCATINNTRTLAEAVAATRAENKKLREALEPFAIKASMMSARSGIPDGDIADEVWVSVRLGTCRRARRALEGDYSDAPSVTHKEGDA